MTEHYMDSTVEDPLEGGGEFQDFVCHLLRKNGFIIQNHCSKKYQFEIGENIQGFEIKFDGRCTDTGRLSIEVYEKKDRSVLNWTESGILRQDNSWMYLQGNYDVIFIFAKNWLLRWYKEKRPTVEEFNGTLKRFFLPIAIAEKFAAHVIWNDENKLFVDK